MTRKKQLQQIKNELEAINTVIEKNNIPIKPIIRIFLNRIDLILKGHDYLTIGFNQPENETTAFNIH